MCLLARDAKNKPIVRQWAAQFSSVDELDEHVRDYFQYRPEMDELIRTPRRMLSDWHQYGFFEGDCDDVATLLSAGFLAMESGPVQLVAIRTDPREEFSHVFVEAFVDGDWWRFDPTVPVGTIHQEYGRMIQVC